MQAAVDCNGSDNSTTHTHTNSSSHLNANNQIEISCDEANIQIITATATATATTTATTNTTATTEGTEAITTRTTLTPTIGATTTTTTTTAIEEPAQILRQRFPAGNPLVTPAAINGTKITNLSSHNDRILHKNGTTNPKINDAVEHLGSNVEPMPITPTPSPETSPSKKPLTVNKPTLSIDETKSSLIGIPSYSTSLTTLTAASPTLSLSPSPSSSSASSSCSLLTNSSNSNSTASSVIATPILARNGNVNMQTVNSSTNIKNNNEIHVPKTLQFSTKSASFNGIIDDTLSYSTPHTDSSIESTTGIFTKATTTAATITTTASSTAIAVSPTSSSNAATAKQLASTPGDGINDANLLHWEDMPRYLQFNPYVLKGYRPLTTFKGCLLSLFYWHNETINILTHAIPILYILAIVPGLMPWEKGYRFLSFCHVFGSVSPWCGSFVYHLFMNIEKGENVYYRLLKLDMVGIWVSQSFGALPLVVATTYCFTTKWKWLVIISYCLFSLWGLYKALTASSPWQRRLCFALPFTMRSILTCLRTLDLVGGNRVALSHVYLQDGVSVLGGAIGAMRIPEKWFPGLVDYYLNSHNIMHVLVVVAVYSMHKATIKDFEWMSGTTCDSIQTNSSAGELIANTLNTNIEL